MKKIARIMGILCFLLLLSGCNRQNEVPVQAAPSLQEVQGDIVPKEGIAPKRIEEKILQEPFWPGTQAVSPEKTGRVVLGEGALEKEASEKGAQETEAPGKETQEKENAVEESSAEASALEAEEEERELTEKELKKLQWSIRSADNGFFACLYDRPEEIDWEQVFYLGAGMNVALDEGQLEIIRGNIREQIRQEREKEEELWYQYLSNNSILLAAKEAEGEEEEPEEEIEVNLTASDVTTLTLRSIQNYVKNKTGMDYSEARKPLQWPSLTRNVFYFVREGSNRVTVRLLRASVKGNLYTLYYRRDNKRGAVEPEYVMKVEIEGNKWKYISNLSLTQTPPATLLDITFYTSGELARLQGIKDMVIATQEETQELRDNPGRQSAGQAPKVYWAVVTALEDQTVLHVDKAYLGDDISLELAREGEFIPGENIAGMVLQKGEKIGIKLTLEDIPKAGLWVQRGAYYGSYAFGSENRLKRFEEDGTPKATYVLGHDLNGEGRGNEYQSKEELLTFLKGTWLYYDSMLGDYTAKLCFDGGDGVSVSMPGLTYHLSVSKWNRVYVDEKAAPDVLTLQSADEATQELIAQWYPMIRKKMGDYRLRSIQRNGMQILYLTPENSGVGCLNYLLPGADDTVDEFIFYRFIGVNEEEPDELESTKG